MRGPHPSVFPFVLAMAAAFSFPQARAADDLSADLKPLLEKYKIPALAVVVIQDGKEVGLGAIGKRKQGAAEEVTLQDRFHLGSCTKSMTATLAALLVQDGKIRWDSKVAEVFPDLKIHEGYQKTTLAQLLNHSGGCPANPGFFLWHRLWKNQGSATEQRLQMAGPILAQAPAYPPGSRELYSNVGISIAGAMLEKVSGQSYEILLTEKLFQPLGMTSAGFRAPATPGKIDQPYGHDPDPVEPEPKGDNPRAIAPAGAVHCSILDWAKYARLHLGQAPHLLSPENLQLLHSPQPPKNDYSFGWSRVSRKWAGGTALMHNGTNTTFYSLIWLAPEKNFAALAVCNSGEESAFEACDEAIILMIRKYLRVEP